MKVVHRRPRLRGLYVVLDATQGEERLLPLLEKALRGGADVVQLWGLWDDRLAAERLARQAAQIAQQHGKPLLIEDDLELAKAVGASGVHLDRANLSPKQVRAVLGEESLVGVTCGSDVERVLWAEREGADYVSFCAIFKSPSDQQCEIVPLTMVREAKRRVGIPVFAAGGITLENAPQVLAAGADGVAVISALARARDPEQAARDFRALIEKRSSDRKTGSLASAVLTDGHFWVPVVVLVLGLMLLALLH